MNMNTDFEFRELKASNGAVLSGACLITPKARFDKRGFFKETYLQNCFHEAGVRADFIQDNHARSAAGIIRGLHFQEPPHAQAKLVRVIRGAVFDVIVDLRTDSATFGAFFATPLSEENDLMLYVPRGFAHGYCALEDGTEFTYKVDNLWNPEAESGLLWKGDADRQYGWPCESPQLSDKDKNLKPFADLQFWDRETWERNP